VLLQVGNIKKDTVALWKKDGQEIKSDEQLSFSEGVLSLEIAQVRGGTRGTGGVTRGGPGSYRDSLGSDLRSIKSGSWDLCTLTVHKRCDKDTVHIDTSMLCTTELCCCCVLCPAL